VKVGTGLACRPESAPHVAHGRRFRRGMWMRGSALRSKAFRRFQSSSSIHMEVRSWTARATSRSRERHPAHQLRDFAQTGGNDHEL
jgi:hypothetical protein